MSKSLGWIAAIGLTLCVVFLGIAFNRIGKFDFFHGFDADFVGDSPVVATADTRQWNWTGDTLEIGVPAEVRIVAPTDGGQAGAATITVHGSQEMLDRVRFSNGRLALTGHLNNISGKHPLDVSIRGTFKNYVLDVGQLNLGHIDQDSLSVRISGAGEVEGEGRVTDLDVAISGLGGAELGELAARNAHVKISGAGEAEIRPSDSADVTLTGVGEVRLRSQPKNLLKHISGLGQIERDDDEDSKDDD